MGLCIYCLLARQQLSAVFHRITADTECCLNKAPRLHLRPRHRDYLISRTFMYLSSTQSMAVNSWRKTVQTIEVASTDVPIAWTLYKLCVLSIAPCSMTSYRAVLRCMISTFRASRKYLPRHATGLSNANSDHRLDLRILS
jgi:hypothetical protein